jgi:hypothetical protein
MHITYPTLSAKDKEELAKGREQLLGEGSPSASVEN